MKQLKDILYRVSLEEVIGRTDQEINAIHFDSREIKTNDCFVAIDGEKANGHDFIEKAVELGATAVICEEMPKNISDQVTYVRVNDSRQALAYMANHYYDSPSKSLKLIGVTGTNGKTTTTSLMYQLFQNLGFPVGLISTVVIKINEKSISTSLTTPDSLTINKHMREMVDAGVEYCFMEVSSHGIDQKRTLGLDFDVAAFTNLSHDHLDYHHSFAEYRDVKKQLFDQLSKTAVAVSNKDDKNGEFILQNTSAKRVFYGIKTIADFRAKILEKSFEGLKLELNGLEVWSRFIGDFNVYNLLAVYAVASQFDLSELEIVEALTKLEPVAGRFQHLVSPKKKVHAVVDYAHTPDALENVLKTLNSIRTNNETLTTIVGCGGNRDKTKRPVMGNIATSLSSQVIFTSDNPRFENPDDIIDDVEAGVEAQNTSKYIRITDRGQAIKTACKMAQANDIILIAGKGHETYQDVNGVKNDFDDVEHVTTNFKLFNL